MTGRSRAAGTGGRWRRNRLPVVVAAAIGARLPRVRAYVQNHGVLDGGRFLLPYPGFDIMPELDWDDLAAMDAAIDSPMHERDSVDDEANFIDTSRTGLAVTTRHVLVDGAAAGDEAVKLITFLRRAPAASEKDFHDVLLGGFPCQPSLPSTNEMPFPLIVRARIMVGRPLVLRASSKASRIAFRSWPSKVCSKSSTTVASPSMKSPSGLCLMKPKLVKCWMIDSS